MRHSHRMVWHLYTWQFLKCTWRSIYLVDPIEMSCIELCCRLVRALPFSNIDKQNAVLANKILPNIEVNEAPAPAIAAAPEVAEPLLILSIDQSFDVINIKGYTYTCCPNMAQSKCWKEKERENSTSCHCHNLFEIKFVCASAWDRFVFVCHKKMRKCKSLSLLLIARKIYLCMSKFAYIVLFWTILIYLRIKRSYQAPYGLYWTAWIGKFREKHSLFIVFWIVARVWFGFSCFTCK